MSNIEWTDSTWNPVIGCRHVAEGCRHCYAETMSKRLAAMGQKDYASILDAKGKFNGRATTRPETLAELLRWKKPRMVFVNSMSDLFHEDVPFEFIAAVFGVMAACPQHTFQVLTKRPERASEFFDWVSEQVEDCEANVVSHYLCERKEFTSVAFADKRIVREWQRLVEGDFPEWPLKNVWLGVSIATQADADKNIPTLLKCPASVRFVSAEPLIEAVLLNRALPCEDCDGNGARIGEGGLQYACELCGGHEDSAGHGIGRGLDWVIVGGESGPGARPCDVAWIRSIVEQCKAAGVAVFVKQLGAHPVVDKADIYEAANAGVRIPRGTKIAAFNLRDRKGGSPEEWPEDLRVREFPKRF